MGPAPACCFGVLVVFAACLWRAVKLGFKDFSEILEGINMDFFANEFAKFLQKLARGFESFSGGKLADVDSSVDGTQHSEREALLLD